MMNGLIDIHTHILPKMDDGSKSTKMSLEMLQAEYAQGVDTVVLTPHFYPQREKAEHFLHRRGASFDALLSAIDRLPEEQQRQLPKMLLGAEVAWCPFLEDIDLDQLCIGNSNSLLLELPLDAWNQKMVNQIYDLQMHQRVLPIFAHFDRYFLPQNREFIPQLLDMKLPIQLGTEPFFDFFQRRRALKLIQHGHGHLIASDCHNMTDRKPNLALALHKLEKKLGSHVAENMIDSARMLTQ